jgi:hypothetical protein
MTNTKIQQAFTVFTLPRGEELYGEARHWHSDKTGFYYWFRDFDDRLIGFTGESLEQCRKKCKGYLKRKIERRQLRALPGVDLPDLSAAKLYRGEEVSE